MLVLSGTSIRLSVQLKVERTETTALLYADFEAQTLKLSTSLTDTQVALHQEQDRSKDLFEQNQELRRACEDHGVLELEINSKLTAQEQITNKLQADMAAAQEKLAM